MRSPDGNVEVLRKKNFSNNEKVWCGWIEIPGHHFLLRGRKFTDPMVFSPNSRFLALTEFIAALQQLVRVVVLDCLTDKQMLAYDEKAESIQDLQTITSLRWIDDSTLRIGASGGDLVESARIWKPFHTER